MTVTHTVGRRAYNNRSGRIIPNVLPRIILIDDNPAGDAFLAIMVKALGPGRATKQEKVTWDVDEYRARTDTTSASATSTATTISVTTATYYNAGEQWMNKRTGEHFYISSVSTAQGNIDVIREISALSSGGGTAKAAMNSGDTLVRIGALVGEDNRRQAYKHTLPAEVFNFTEAKRWDISVSRRQMKREFENDDEFSYLEKKQMVEARRELNAMFIAGERGRFDHPSMGDTTMTDGFRSVIATNTFPVGGTLFEYDFDDWLINEALVHVTGNVLFPVSRAVMLAFTQMGKDRLSYQVDLGGKKGAIGVQVTEYVAPNGVRLMMFEDRYLSEVFSGEGFTLDGSMLERRVFSNNGIDDDLHLIANTEDDDDMGRVDTLYCDMGLQYGAEVHHGYLSGVTGGAKGAPGIS